MEKTDDNSLMAEKFSGLINYLIASLQDRPLTPEMCAEFTGYSVPYVYQLAREKKIPHYKSLGKIVFRKSEVEDFLYRKRVAADYEVSQQADAKLNGEGK